MSGPLSARRPDPDALLAQVRHDDTGAAGAAGAPGRLKVFFGAAPGVGKTYTMLEAARARRDEGVDVVVGYVETHGRAQTERLLEGLEIIPRGRVAYRGRELPEFDLDAALARRPRLLLVDELAHTNAPGSRHTKRWQDVLELVGAGIDVYTTVNVQHLESLNDVVARVTGVVVRETVPDAVLERADEVELVDLPPDDLLRRLREGNVYVPEQAERAAQNFFKKGNLIALRELALRRTAERVDQQMRGYMRAHGIDETWPVAERALVCVGPSPASARLVRAARRMSGGGGGSWFAVSVESTALAKPSPEAAARVAEHLRLAESLGAQTATLAGPNVADEVVAFARQHNVTKIVVGKPTHPRWRDVLYGSLVDEIIRKSGDVDVQVITGDDAESRPGLADAPAGPAGAALGASYAWAAAAVTAATLAGRAMFPRFERADIVMVYLLAVVLVSFRLPRGPSTLAALASIAAFDFFFVPPYLTFAVGDLNHFITFATMLLVGMVVSGLAHRVRGQAEAAREREQRTASLYAASRDFAGTTGLEPLAQVAARHVRDVFGGEVLVLLPAVGGRLTARAGDKSAVWTDKERGVAQWAFEHRQAAGLGTDTLPSAAALYIPLEASRGVVGVLGLRPPGGRPLGDPALRHQLNALTSQAALALERALLVHEAQASQLAVERERLLNALLSSVSHDLRTPLASITGAAGSLLDDAQPLPAEARRDLLQTVHQEAARLNRLVTNLLDMTRVTAGHLAVKKEWQPLEEALGAALTRLESELRGRVITTHLPEDLPLVPIDGVLIAQVFVNLLENALKYTPEGAPITIAAVARAGDGTNAGDGTSAGEATSAGDGTNAGHGANTSAGVNAGEVIVSLDDRGPGVPPAEAARIFEMFFRGDRTRAAGTGLGLAICRGIVAAHGGRIWVEPAKGGGASFRFSLPLEGPPPPNLDADLPALDADLPALDADLPACPLSTTPRPSRPHDNRGDPLAHRRRAPGAALLAQHAARARVPPARGRDRRRGLAESLRAHARGHLARSRPARHRWYRGGAPPARVVEGAHHRALGPRPGDRQGRGPRRGRRRLPDQTFRHGRALGPHSRRPTPPPARRPRRAALHPRRAARRLRPASGLRRRARGTPHAHRVQAACHARAERGPRRHPRAALERGVGAPSHDTRAIRSRLHGPATPQARI